MTRCTERSSAHQEDFPSPLTFRVILECGYNTAVVHFQPIPTSINQAGAFPSCFIAQTGVSHMALEASWGKVLLQLWWVTYSFLCTLSYWPSVLNASFPYYNGLLLDLSDFMIWHTQQNPAHNGQPWVYSHLVPHEEVYLYQSQYLTDSYSSKGT